jgi:MtN3 and saliva related transmembrane protein
MNFETIVGVFASVATASSLVPQLIKIIKEKKAESVSLIMILILFTGLAGWIWYGILKNDYIIIISNAFSMIVNVLIAVFSIKYKLKK